MQGKGNVRFSELFRDTLEAHGWLFAYEHYVLKGGMADWEWQFWLGAA